MQDGINPLQTGGLFQNAGGSRKFALLAAAQTYQQARAAELVAAGELSSAEAELGDLRIRLQAAEEARDRAVERYVNLQRLADDASENLMLAAERL